MEILDAVGRILSQYILPLAIALFLLVIAGNMFRDRKGLRSGGPTYTGIIDRAGSDPLALHIWDFLTGDRRWGVDAPNPRIIDRAALVQLDGWLVEHGLPLTAPRGARSPAVAYLTERFPALLPKGWRVLVAGGPAGVQVRLSTGGAPEFASQYNPADDVSAAALYDLCQAMLYGVGARYREPRDPQVGYGVTAGARGLAG